MSLKEGGRPHGHLQAEMGPGPIEKKTVASSSPHSLTSSESHRKLCSLCRGVEGTAIVAINPSGDRVSAMEQHYQLCAAETYKAIQVARLERQMEEQLEAVRNTPLSTACQQYQYSQTMSAAAPTVPTHTYVAAPAPAPTVCFDLRDDPPVTSYSGRDGGFIL